MVIEKDPISAERLERSIHVIRGRSVMVDRDRAGLYGIETRALNPAVARNPERFPPDFMFRPTREEVMRRSQSVTSSTLKFSKSVFVFTEQGVAMLSSLLRSPWAIQELMAEPEPVRKKQIGFHVRERRAQYGRIRKAEERR